MKKVLSLILCPVLLCLTSCEQSLFNSKPASSGEDAFQKSSVSAPPQDFEESFPDYEGTVTLWCYFDEPIEMGERERALHKKVIDGYQAGVLVRAFLNLESLEEVPLKTDALSDRPFEEFTAETLPVPPNTYFISLDNEKRLYRFHDMPVLVDEFLGKGAAWSGSYVAELRDLVSNTFDYWPCNSYYGTAKEGINVTNVLKMPAPIEITVTDLKRTNKVENTSFHNPPIDEITLSVYARKDLHNVSIALQCTQGDDIILTDGASTRLFLKKGERTTVKLEYASDVYSYVLDITAPDTKITLTVDESYFQS